MGAELAEAGVVHLAVEGDVVLDLSAAVDAVQDVALQVVVDGVVLLQGVQRDLVERQRFGDFLQRTSESSATLQKIMFVLDFVDAFDVFSTEKITIKQCFFSYFTLKSRYFNIQPSYLKKLCIKTMWNIECSIF